MAVIRITPEAQYGRTDAHSETSSARAGTTAGRRRTEIALWAAQGLLAALFLFAGGMKLIMPIEELTAQMPLPGWFLRFIGASEFLGAIGLVLPGLLRIRPGLTPLAACGLVIIMTGATVITLPGGAVAAIPFITGVLAACVARGRRSALRELFR